MLATGAHGVSSTGSGAAVQRRIGIDAKTVLSSKSSVDDIEKFLDEHAGDDEYARGYLEVAIRDSIDRPVAELVSDMPLAKKEPQDDRAEPVEPLEAILGYHPPASRESKTWVQAMRAQQRGQKFLSLDSGPAEF